ncbi:hypothetical protein [Cupriavidus sp. H39]|uniref:hypothetical protein n=1 Tax=Cupriavidus sp. H39 TaxID=3401635 RepID=UPI003CFEC5F2
MSQSTLRIFVLNVPEFAALTEAAQRMPACRLSQLGDYTVIACDEPVEFGRRALGLKPAVWYGLFTGGLDGRIARFDRDIVRIVPRDAAQA